MPGIDLNLPIPSLSDTQTQVVTKTAQALFAVNADLAAKVVTSEIDINANLPINGFGLTNVGSAQFATSTPITTPGTIFYYNGEWFVVDSTNVVQLTSNGGINLAVVGAIGGDYTSANALVSYDSANSRYRFFGSGATSLVDLDARYIVANATGAAGKVTFGADSALATNIAFNVKSVPAAAIGILGYDASVGAVVDGSTITAATSFTNNITFTNTVTFNGLTKHTTWSTEIPMFVGEETQTNVQTGAGQLTGVVSANPSIWSSSPLGICGLRVNDVVQSIVVRITKASAALATVSIFKRAAGGSTTAVPLNAGNTSTATGAVDITATVTTPTAIASRERWWVQIAFTNASVTAATVNWTQ